MSIPVYVRIEEGVELPQFPGDPSEYEWQTKDLPPSGMSTSYHLTSDGRLLRKEEKSREKTDEEKQAEAEEHGFDTWDEYYNTVKEADIEETVKNDWPTGIPKETTIGDTWWADHNMHGSFEFHTHAGTITTGEQAGNEYYWSYEARFTRGSLDEIIFLGERGGPNPNEDEHVPPNNVEF